MCVLCRDVIFRYTFYLLKKIFLGKRWNTFHFHWTIKQYVFLSVYVLLTYLNCIYCKLIHSLLLVPHLECFLPFVISALALIIICKSIINASFIFNDRILYAFRSQNKFICSDEVFCILAAHIYILPEDPYSKMTNSVLSWLLNF